MAPLATQWLSSLNRLLSRLIRNLATLLQLHFAFNGPFGDAMAEQLKPLAESINQEPGFLWKVWTESEKNHEAGGIYLFTDEKSALAYLEKHTARLKNLGVEEVVAKVFDSDAPDFLNLVFFFVPLFLLCIQYVKRFTLSSYELSEGESLWQLCYNFILLLMAHLATQCLSSLNRLLSRLIRKLVFCGRYLFTYEKSALAYLEKLSARL